MQNEIDHEQIRLRTFPDPVLRKRSKEVKFMPDVKTALRRMADIMYANNGIGLAAPQVGLSLRMFVVDTGEGLREFLNPRIVASKGRSERMEEGCLSVPGIGVEVARPAGVTITAFNADGEAFTEELSGLAARAFQHENDHLDGRLIIDHLNPLRRFVVEGRFRRGGGKLKKTCEVTCYDGKRRTGRS